MHSAIKRLAALFVLGGILLLSLSLLPNLGTHLYAKPALRVVTTSPIFADMIQNVGGDRVEVKSIVPLGTDPHPFDPTPRGARHCPSGYIVLQRLSVRVMAPAAH